MRLLSSITVGVVFVAFACLCVAGATALPTAAAPLGGGTATVNACDQDGVTFRHTVDTAGRLSGVTVTSIATTCAGGLLRLTLANGTTEVGAGSAALPSVGFTGSATLAMSPAPQSNQVTAVHLVIEGP